MLRGQVSTEYLVVLAIVLVVALVVVYLMGGFAGMGAGTVQTQSLDAWGSASPFSITILRQSGTNLEMEMRNSDVNELTLTGISMDNASVFSGNLTFSSGQGQVVNATLPSPCTTVGSQFIHQNVIIHYDEGAITDKIEVGLKPLIGSCS